MQSQLQAYLAGMTEFELGTEGDVPEDSFLLPEW
jgi:hypothetical protein